MFCRTGNSAKLSVEYFDQNKRKQTIENERFLAQDIRNPRIILNKETDLVVGGVPSKMKLPSEVDAVNYTGCFDGLQVNNHFVGSWNSDVSYYWSSGGPKGRQAEPHTHIGKKRKPMIFSWLSCLAVLLLGAATQSRNMAAILQKIS